MPNTGPDRRQYIHVVAAVIRDQQDPGRIFITQRKQGQHLQNLWEFPGGKVEAGEAPYHALKRELHEETGITVSSAQPFQSVFHRYPDKAVFLDVWEVNAYTGEPHGREQQQGKWIPLGQLGDYEFPAADDPVLQALTLPAELLITPDVSVEHQHAYLQQFEQLLQRHAYPLVLFRSPQLEDATYVDLAMQMQDIGRPSGSRIVIERNNLKSIKNKAFEPFKHRHLSAHLLNALKRRPFDDSITLSASCHGIEELTLAQRLGCRYALVSSVRETDSHPGRPAKGWFGFNRLARRSHLPLYALGGVRRRDLAVARYQGAIGVAGISDFWSA